MRNVLTPYNYGIIRLNFSRFIKKALLTLLMLKVEVFFSSISIKLSGESTNHKFQNIVNHVLKQVFDQVL